MREGRLSTVEEAAERSDPEAYRERVDEVHEMNSMDLRRLYRKRLKEAGDRHVRDVMKGRDNIFTSPGRGILDIDQPKHLLSEHKSPAR